ncbi:MAG: hypothetical protein AUI93_00935 [Crenarchaeota archaeon 13_1_40CM_3_52_10]|nr:MAG: hypothetical protein AUI93_00935 [Crenarchaeota archaeon 13_1_40CM_3_52_10]
MGPRGKILTSILLIIIVIIAVWQFTSPVLIPSVGTKYLSSKQYANRGSWTVLEVSGYGKVFLAFSIANTTYPRTTLPTSYSVIVSKVNETALPSYIRGFTVKLTALRVQDNYDGSTSAWARSGDFPDAAQATTLFNFQTSANHHLKFTISYQLYEILFIGSLVDHPATQSFNITQNVV